MVIKFYTSILFTLLLFSTNTFADTFGKVVDILNQSCTSSGCHNADSKIAGLDLSGDRAQIYKAIVNKKPVNQIAQEILQKVFYTVK